MRRMMRWLPLHVNIATADRSLHVLQSRELLRKVPGSGMHMLAGNRVILVLSAVNASSPIMLLDV